MKNLSELNNEQLLNYYQEIKERRNQNDMLQKALKEQLNSAFGALGNQYFRFYDVRQAEAITLSGRMINFYLESALNKILNKVSDTQEEDFIIASDTDSWYMCLEKVIEKIEPNYKQKSKQEIVDLVDKLCNKQIQKIFDKNFLELKEKLNAFKLTMNVKREVIADKGVWTAKKKYMLNVYDKEGVRFEQPKLVIKGLEAIKSGTPDFCKVAIKKLFSIAMNETEHDVQDFISNFRQEFNKQRAEVIAEHVSVSYLKKYNITKLDQLPKGVPYNSKGSILYNLLLKQHKIENVYPPIQEGDKVSIVALRTPHIYGDKYNYLAFSNMIPTEFELHDYIDYDVQFQKVFLDPVKRIIDVMKWKVEKSNSLLDLFN